MLTAIACTFWWDINRVDTTCRDIKLLLAATLQRNKPKSSRIYTMTTSRQQAMILVQSCFNTSKGLSHIRASMVFHRHRACFITDNHMIFKKGTSILCYRLNWPARCRPCRAINCMGMTHGNNIRMLFMNIGM